MSDRVARTVELASIAVIGCCVLFFGWTLLQNLIHFRAMAGALLLLVGGFEIASIRRNLSELSPAGRIRATRDAAFLVAVVLALSELLIPQRWIAGACIAAAEFGIVLELLARVQPP